MLGPRFRGQEHDKWAMARAFPATGVNSRKAERRSPSPSPLPVVAPLGSSWLAAEGKSESEKGDSRRREADREGRDEMERSQRRLSRSWEVDSNNRSSHYYEYLPWVVSNAVNKLSATSVFQQWEHGESERLNGYLRLNGKCQSLYLNSCVYL